VLRATLSLSARVPREAGTAGFSAPTDSHGYNR
jgi:hypothetical protein